jgi:hypothetical protein
LPRRSVFWAAVMVGHPSKLDELACVDKLILACVNKQLP